MNNDKIFLCLEENKKNLKKFLDSKETQIVFSPSERPLVSIIILTFNKAETTLKCLESLVTNIYHPYELIIIDNNSQDNTHELLGRVRGATVILNKENVFYARGCNQGAVLAKGEYLLFLNNDLEVFKDFDKELVDICSLHKDVGAVGGQLIHLNDELQEAGCTVWNDGTPWAYSRGCKPESFECSFVREVDYCSAAMMLITKKLFEIVGGFDLIYEPAYFEDTDLSMKIRQQGKRFLFTPFAKAYHHERGSIGKFGALELMIKNQRTFFNKWLPVLRKDHFSEKSNILKCRERAKGLRILYIDNRVPVPSSGGGYPRANKLVRFLASLGNVITLFPVKKDTVSTEAWSEDIRSLGKLGVEIVQGDNRFADFARSRNGYYDLIIVSRYSALQEVFFSLKEILPSVPVIFDSEAVNFQREFLKAEYEGVKLLSEEKEQIKKDELAFYKFVDFSIFVSELDRKLIQDELGDSCSDSIVLGHSLDSKKYSKSFHTRKNFFFIGGFLGTMNLNEHAIKYYIEKCWEKVHQRTNACFHIAGSNIPEEIRQLRSKSLIIKGHIDDLDKAYSEVRVVVAAHQYSGGIPLKIYEALSHGVPCVISNLLAKQMNINEMQGVAIASCADDFIEKSINLYNDEVLWEQKSKNALEFIETFHSGLEWENTIREVLKKFSAN